MAKQPLHEVIGDAKVYDLGQPY
ncbi:uncharacterized protein METZ01_LOCUS362596, partial [marine metagenome]